MLPLFKRSEAHEIGESDYHGGRGGLSVSLIRAKSDIPEAFIDAAVEMGVPRTDGRGLGFRCSNARAFLNPARKRPNLQIVTRAHTEALIFDPDNLRRVVGVRYSRNGQPQGVRLAPGGEVVLSADAIDSPQILELSGIGRGEVLKGAGVDVRHELKGVGEALQDHLQIRLVYEVNVRTLNDAIYRFLPRMGIGLNYVLFRKGPMSLGASQGLDTPDIQFHFQPLSADKPGIEMHPFSGITSSVCQLRPESRGNIHIATPRACDQLRVRLEIRALLRLGPALRP